MNRRVVITGMGVVTPVGIGVDEFSNSLCNGTSGEGPITRFETNGFHCKKAFEVKNFRPLDGTRLLDPYIQYALVAAAEALQNSGIDLEVIDPFRIGIVVSSSKGGMHTFHKLNERFAKNPSAILAARIYSNSIPNFASQWIARKWKVRGPAKCYVTACASGTTSIIEAARMIEEGIVDYAFAGASDASIVPLLMAGYEKMRVLSPDGMHPFDSRRKGFLLGEGAGVVILETLESAEARRAKIFSEIVGHAYATDCHHPLSFDMEDDALGRAIRGVLKKARLSDDEIDYLNLHGTGTQDGDVYETEQIKRVFGERAYSISTSSTKSMTGHMLGATGAVEIIACCLAMQNGFVPPTLSLEKKDPRCDLDYTAKKSRKKKINTSLSISLGFGGHIAAIALRKV